MKKYIEMILRKIGVSMLALLIVMTTYFSNSGGSLFLKTKKVQADTGETTLAMSQAMSRNKIPAIGRAASEGLWAMTAGGHRVFCLNSGKTMCSGDTLKYKTVNAATYEKKGIAKALQWYFMKSNKNTKALALTQAYIWACGHGANKQNTVYQAGKNVQKGYSQNDAKKFCETISDQDPEGTIYYYTVKKCVKKKKLDSHQVLFGFRHTPPPIKKAKTNATKTMESPDNVKIKIRKKDAETREGLAGAVFQIYMDGTLKGTVQTDENGEASYTVQRTLSSKGSSKDKTYVTNWNDLSKAQKKEAIKNGWYDSRAKAYSVALQEAVKDAQNKIAAMKSASVHTWMIRETKSAFGHLLPSQTDQSKVEQGGVRSFTFNYTNEFKMVDLEIFKQGKVKNPKGDLGVEANLKNAVYELYAARDITGSDNKSTVYTAGTLITQLVTDANGYAKVTDLYPGYYRLHEKTAPLGYKTSSQDVYVTVDKNTTQYLPEDEYEGTIEVVKTFGGKNVPEAQAVFEIYDSKNNLKETITTDTNGVAQTSLLPYGAYRIHQTKTTDGYEMVPDKWLTIDGSKTTYKVESNDPEKHAAIAVTKVTRISDKETNIYTKKEEYKAEFQIINKETKKVVETLVTDENGAAQTGELQPGTYTVHQTKGTKNYKIAEDFDVTIKDGDKELHKFEIDNPYDGPKVRIKKTMVRNGKSKPEPGAEFVILDESLVKEFKDQTLVTSEDRIAYIEKLEKSNKEAILGTMVTDSEGSAAMLLKDFTKDSGFIVLQTRGVEDYDLAAPQYSSEMKAKKEDSGIVYEFTMSDDFTKSAKISIKKQMSLNKDKYVPEAGARFQIIDPHGDVVDTLTTDEKGEATSIPLAIGVYTLHQTYGDPKHEMMEDEDVVLIKSDVHKTVTFGPYNDDEKMIEIELTKRSKETKKLLNGAVYEIYDEDKDVVATLTTGTDEDGKASCYLPYGKYTIKETKAPAGYNMDDAKEQAFELSGESTSVKITYDNAGNGTYRFDQTDSPVPGQISLSKKGEVLSDYDKEAQSFVYENDKITGAVYGLYADEDIKKDDGSVVWKKDTLIDQKTTTKDDEIYFTRTGDDGTETRDFYLGKYYIKEIKAPAGYVVDQEKHEVELNWDTTAGNVNDMGDSDKVPDKEDPFGNDGNDPSSGVYVLEKGEKLNEKIKEAETVTFTWVTAPEGTSTKDVSQNKDGSVVLWNDGTDYYISSQRAGQVIYMNAVSAKMFRDCSEITKIDFKNIDTASVVDMSQMFYGMDSIKTLDLSSFNTSNVEDMSQMFYGDPVLKTTYVMDQILKIEEDKFIEEQPVKIKAMPKNSFLKGDKFKAKDFSWRIEYDDDGAEDVDVTDDDVEFTPTVAEKGGKMKLNVNFKSTGKYAKFQTIQTTVDVIDLDEEDIALKTAKKASVSIEANDVLQKYSIHLIKTDQDGKKLAGAEFALKAKTDIVNGKGNTIFKKGDTIATAISQDDQFEYLEFIGLPTDIYAKDGTGCEMYEVVETSAPAGYEGSDKKLTLKGEVINNTKENLIHDVKAENNTDNDTSTYIHDSDTFVNQKSEYIALKKIWDDHNDAAKIRPTSIRIKATHKTTKEVKTYTLSKDNNWMTFTDIKKDDKDNWKFTEDVPAQYTLTSTHWDDEMYVFSFTNFHETPKYVNINVQKVWEDGNNVDGIRPASIRVQLYRDGEKYRDSIVLNESNNWTDNTTFQRLDKYDKAGEEHSYEIKEESFDGLTGDAKTDYVDSYETNETTDTDGTTTKNIIITNTHTPETTQKKVKKIWNDNGNKDGIRPKSVTVNLLADGKVEESFTLSAENNWQAKSKLLPVKVNGKKVNYTWEEVKEDLITGESEIGYKPSYDTDATDQDLTLITNFHDRTEPKGSVTITKALDPGNLNMDVGDPSFTFTLSGMDVYGKKHSYEKQIKFTKAEVEKQMKDHPGDPIELSVTFDDLEYGTYTCDEGGMLKYFKLKSLTSDSSNAIVDQKKGTVTFEIGPTGMTAKAQLKGTAKFTNQMIQGSIKLVKKDSNGRALKDVEFEIHSSDGAQVAKAKTDAAGEITFDGLIPDTYTITETKTKEGKTLLKEPITATIPLTMSQAEVDKQKVDTSKAIKDGNTYYFYHMTYEVTNDARLDLPKTGGWMDYLPLAGGMILILGGLFVYYRKKKGGLKEEL